MKALLAALLTVAWVATGCAGGIREVDLPTPRVTPSSVRSMSAGDATISILEPKAGAQVSRPVEVIVHVAGFRLVPPDDPDPREGEGHIVYYSGQSYGVPVAPDRPATQGGSGSFTSAPSAETSYRWGQVGPGSWMFAAQLVGADGAPLTPPHVAAVMVTVAA